MKRQWTEAELDAHWALAAQEEALLVGCSGHGRFGFVVLLKFFQYEGRFPESRREIPADVMCYLATQLGMPLNTLDDFDWQGRTAMRQRAEILEWLGIRRMEESDWHALAMWLDAEVLPSDPSLEQLIERTAEWLRNQQLDVPGADRLNRMLRAQANAFEGNLLKQITDQIGNASCVALDALLRSPTAQPADTPQRPSRQAASHTCGATRAVSAWKPCSRSWASSSCCAN